MFVFQNKIKFWLALYFKMGCVIMFTVLKKLFISLLLSLVMSVFWPELPCVLVRSLHIVDTDIMQDFLQVNLKEKCSHWKTNNSGLSGLRRMKVLFFTTITKFILNSYHRLFGDVHQVFYVVVLVLLKGREQHVQHLLFVYSRPFARLLLFPFILELQQKIVPVEISHTGFFLKNA